jgi:hypothetical protein
MKNLEFQIGGKNFAHLQYLGALVACSFIAGCSQTVEITTNGRGQKAPLTRSQQESTLGNQKTAAEQLGLTDVLDFEYLIRPQGAQLGVFEGQYLHFYYPEAPHWVYPLAFELSRQKQFGKGVALTYSAMREDLKVKIQNGEALTAQDIGVFGLKEVPWERFRQWADLAIKQGNTSEDEMWIIVENPEGGEGFAERITQQTATQPPVRMKDRAREQALRCREFGIPYSICELGVEVPMDEAILPVYANPSQLPLRDILSSDLDE